MEQLNDESNENPNADSEGCGSSIQSIVKNEMDMIATTATNEEDSRRDN